MTDWTKPESYNAKAIAWYEAKERLRDGPALKTPSASDLDRWAATSSFGAVESFRSPRIRAEWGGRRSGKTERMRNWAIDHAYAPSKAVRAQWINGRLWILD